MHRGRRRTAVTRLVVVALAAFLLIGLLGTPPAFAGSRARGRMLELTNNARLQRGLPKLRLNFRISDDARAHSRWMARNGLRHSPDVPSLLSSVRWTTWGENVGYTGRTLSSLHRAFMASTGHRHNILGRSFRRVGIGVVRVDGSWWATLIFYG